MIPTDGRAAQHQPTFAELYTPKLVTVLREGYGASMLRADAIAGLTVAVVALPLSMALAIASGAPPERGLYTAIVGGFLISMLGGSRFQIGGPAGAFIVLISATIERHGFEGFLLATFMAGFFLLAIGFLRLGAYIKYIPHPVTVGFTTGIAVIIFASQIRDLLGLTFAQKEPSALLPKLQVLGQSLGTINPAAVGVAAASIALIVVLRRYRPKLPGFLIAVVLGAVATYVFNLPVETIGSKFGGVPSNLPTPSLPTLSPRLMLDVLPDALAFTLLGGIESLLSAVVADGMTGRRHRSNCELVAQGVANIGSAIFGGICATGTIARTATNVRSGAVGPVSGMLHAVFLLLMMLLAAPLMAHIPLATLAGVLAVVSWNMAEKDAFLSILRHSRGEALVLLATFLLTIFRDLTEGIAVGVVLGSFQFMHRMANMVAVETGTRMMTDDVADTVNGQRKAYDARMQSDRDVMIYRIAGPLFFGAATNVATVLERIGQMPRAFVIDVEAVPFADSTAAISLKTFIEKANRAGVAVYIAGASPHVRRIFVQEGIREPMVQYAANAADARALLRE